VRERVDPHGRRSSPARRRAFSGPLGTVDVLEIEPGRHLTFEYIGDVDVFGEGGGRPRRRGTRCTSVDAAFLRRSTAEFVELVLVEWKSTEMHPPRDRTGSDTHADADTSRRTRRPAARCTITGSASTSRSPSRSTS
jgi:Restriction Endonuclease associating with ARP